MADEKSTSWVTWTVLGLIWVMLVVFAGGWVLRSLDLKRSTDPVEEKRKSERWREDQIKDAANPVKIGDSLVKIHERCGTPDNMSSLDTKEGSFDVFVYASGRDIPSDCWGQLGMADGFLVRISRSTY